MAYHITMRKNCTTSPAYIDPNYKTDDRIGYSNNTTTICSSKKEFIKEMFSNWTSTVFLSKD